MTNRRFYVPQMPWELLEESRCRASAVWALEDLELRNPALVVDWDRPETPGQSHSSAAALCKAPIGLMVRDPEVDVRSQLQRIREEIEHLEAGRQIGIGLANYPGMHLVHFGTGPLATAFGSRFIVREDEQPFFEPAVHTPQEALDLRKPDLRRVGILPRILERIEYYNEATRGEIPMCVCDSAGPWSVATQVWHYEDMLEATRTAPEAVHHLLDLVTECLIEWTQIQVTHMARWIGNTNIVPWPWHSRGTVIGDDTMVSVSPTSWEEFFLPYNNRLSRRYGGVFYHCCMCYEAYFPSLAKTDGFMGFDAMPEYNDINRIEAALSGRGVWWHPLGDLLTEKHGTSGRRDDLPLIKRLRGKAGMFLGVHGDSRQDAIDRARHLLDSL